MIRWQFNLIVRGWASAGVCWHLPSRRPCGSAAPSVYLCTNAKMTENQVFYPRLGYVEYERKIEAGYDRIFYRKRLQGR